ncbi:MAG: IS30 family transposase [Candidatus Berkelbacteria bacterium]
MKNNYKHLDQHERDRIEALLSSGHKSIEIAKILGRDKGTISREINNNRKKIRQRGGTIDGPYQATVAHHKAYVRRWQSKYSGKKINANPDIEKYIIEGLKNHWSPDEISGRMRHENKPFYASKNLIYDWLYSAYGQRYCPLLCTKRYDKKKYNKKTTKVMISDRIGIEMRPVEVSDRSTFGHLEADTIVSGKRHKTTTSLAVMQERKSRHLSARKIKNLSPKTFTKSIKSMSKKLIKKETITLDNGIENRDHKNLPMTAFFCDPYSSWQKGGVENGNKMIRRFIPKGCNIDNYSDQYISHIIGILNKKPRKSLGYKTPIEVLEENNLLVKNRSRKVALRG